MECQSERGVIMEKLENNGFKQFLNSYTKSGIYRDLDPTQTCKYYDCDSLNAQLKNKSSLCSLFHLNVRRLGKHRGELLALLSALNHTFEVIVLTEIGHDAAHFINKNLLPNYTHFLKLPKNNKYGGVAIFIENDFGTAHVREDLSLSNDCNCDKCQIEDLWIEINNNNKFIIGGIYRHPNGNERHFIDDLDRSTAKIDKNNVCFLVGDINMDLMKFERDNTFDYFTTLSSQNFVPCITTPTRVNDRTSTLIDHIFVRLPPKLYGTDITSGNILADISDHLPNFVALNNSKIQTKTKRPMIRIYSERNTNNFKSILEETDWNNFLVETDPQILTDKFYTHLHDSFNNSFPIVRQSRTRAKDKKWITTGLIKCINKKNALFRKQLSSPTDSNKNKYKTYKNILSKCLKQSEIMHYSNLFADSKNAATTFWKSFGHTLNPKKQKNNQNIEKLVIDGETLSSNIDIANGFNDFFCTVGDRINNSLPGSTGHFRDYMRNKITETFFLAPIREEDILKELKKLNAKKSSGPDDFPNKLLSLSAEYIYRPITQIFNASISEATYPDKWKLAKVIALYKKSSRHLPENYRPISLLDCISKIFERQIYNQMIKFIDKHKILYINQFGFRKNYSTTLALIDTVDFIKTALDDNDYVIGIFLDIKKAFDSVNHAILCKKLEDYGFRGHSLQFLTSYLTNRKQFTVVNHCKSSTSNINFGVPQGSILGPLLFLLYINDLQYAITSAQSRLFADDTSVLLRGKNLRALKAKAEDTLKEISQWFLLNRLSLSLSKSNFILFHGKRKDPARHIDCLNIGNDSIPRVESATYIGLTIDEVLSWEPHIATLCRSLIKYFSVFYNIRQHVNDSLARTIYFACLYSRIAYGIEVYGSASDNNINRIQRLQNKLMKLLTKKEPRYCTNTLHSGLNILKVKDIYETSVLKFTFNCVNGNPIPKFSEFFRQQDNLHGHNTRQRRNLTRKRINTEIGRATTHFTGATLWNNLPSQLTDIKTVHSFKRNLFKHYVSKYSD